MSRNRTFSRKSKFGFKKQSIEAKKCFFLVLPEAKRSCSVRKKVAQFYSFLKQWKASNKSWLLHFILDEAAQRIAFRWLFLLTYVGYSYCSLAPVLIAAVCEVIQSNLFSEEFQSSQL